jgi:hypothetical protein
MKIRILLKMKIIKLISLSSLLFLFGFCGKIDNEQDPEISEKALSDWSEGYLDIHNISTGKGESTFYIFPDGTTMLVDAGVTSLKNEQTIDAKPNESKTPGQWIAHYINHFMNGLPEKKIHYIHLSHFHEDHFGGILGTSKYSEYGNYYLSGLTEVGEILSLEKIVDRGWPDYNWPSENHESSSAENYIRFVQWQVANRGLNAEKFKVGTNQQFVLLNDPEKYPEFQIRNIYCNGYIWTGVGDEKKNLFPEMESLNPKDYPNENLLCAAFKLSYGKFDYFSGGDIYYDLRHQWGNIEKPIGRITGEVDASKANHHGVSDANGMEFLSELKPSVIVIQTYDSGQAQSSALRNMFAVNSDVFITDIPFKMKTRLGESTMEKLKFNEGGHVVIRVSPGGNEYMVYVLDHLTTERKVKASFGPYNSK